MPQVQVERERQNAEGLTRICELRSGELEQVLDECDMLRKENARCLVTFVHAPGHELCVVQAA